MPSHSRVLSRIAPLLTAIALASSGVAILAAPAHAAATDVKINEVRSDPTDTVEFFNTGTTAVDLTGYIFKDDDNTHSYPLPSGTTIAAGGYLVLDITAFGLGKGDSARLFAPDGTTLLDSTTWPAGTHATTWGRCPNGTGSFVAMTPTLGSTNACATPDSAVKVNEFSSNNPDFIELLNTGSGAVDLSGWVLKDNTDNNSYTFPAGSSIAAGAYKVLNGESVDFVFGLGNGDSVRLYSDADLTTPLDSYTYPAHPPAGKSYGRCPNGTGAFEITAAATKGAANQCAIPTGGENIKINEVQSDPGDLIELTNIGETTVDISGYVLKDNDDTHVYTIAAGTTLAPHAYVTFDVNVAFGLGKGDSARLYQPNLANLLDSTTWPADSHAADWGRCPNGTGTFATVTNTLGAANSCGTEPSGPPDVVINEVESNGDQVADWVELKNRSASAVNVGGWKILDNDPAHVTTPVVIPANTTIAAGGYYAIYTEINQTPGFGLGGADSATLLLPDGTTTVDSTSWTTHAATTWGRCPDGTGDFRATTASTRGLPNACSPVRINEVDSHGSPSDWVELTNISAASVDVGGFVVKDNNDAHAYTLPTGTAIAAKGYLSIDESTLGFAFDDADSVRLFDAGGTVVEQYSWTTPAVQSYARCKDGLGDFKDAKAPTRGAVNSCPGLDTTPWPGSQTVSYADRTETFTQDLSGLAFDPADPDVLWGAQNKLGTLFKLTRDADNNFVPAATWPKNPTYPDGSGAPDTEGITIGPDGFVYLAAERNNSASGVSRMSILRYDPAAAGASGSSLPATMEWNLTSQIPAAGANLGLEGVAFVPDSYLTSNGFKDNATGAPYNPASYPLHGSGLYVVAVEDTGDLIAFVLNSDGTSVKIATIDSGFEHLADVNFDPELQRLWAVTDDTHDGRTSQLKIDSAGAFVVDTAHDRPVGMPNLNNEGLAIAPQSRCVAGAKEVLWSDDGDTDGHSLRRGTINCTVLALTTATPTISGTAAVGQTLTADAGTWGPAPVSLSYAWYAGATQISGAEAASLVLTPDLVGQQITVTVTGAKTGYPTRSETSVPTAAVALGELTSSAPTIGGTVVVDGTATVDPGTWGPAPVTLSYQWLADGQPISGATGTSLSLGSSLAGAALTVAVTGTKSGYGSVTKTSSATTVATGTLASATPTIGGTVVVDGTATVDPGTWGPAPVALSYQWLANGQPISGATGTSLSLGSSLAGASLTVAVTGTKSGYGSVTKTSSASMVAAGTLVTGTPTISGVATVGNTLAANSGSWGPTPVDLSFQWFAGANPIAGATGLSLVLGPELVGKAITLQVTGTRAGYATASQTSAAVTVAPGALTGSTPRIAGKAKVGKTLRAITGSWGPKPVALSVRWYANGKAIGRATASTLKLTGKLKGKRITVRVTGTKVGYTSLTKASAATAKVAAGR